MCVVQSTSIPPSPSLPPSHCTILLRRGAASWYQSHSWMLPTFRVTFAAYRQKWLQFAGFWGFFSCILMFCSFFMVLFLLFKKAPLQSVIPITIIHLKNSIYRFIYIFLYIYFYVQDVLASLSDEQLSKSRRTWWFVQHLDFKGCLLEEMP